METKALIVTDIQYDFCPGGKLQIPGGDEIIPVVNKLIDYFEIIVATQDWHPRNHVSFAINHKNCSEYDVIDINGIFQVLWPEHSVQNTLGAEFHKDLNKKKFSLILRKGFRSNLDSYSAFFENDRKTPTGLTGYLQTLGINEVYFCGLALDYCVYYSAVDAINSGFKAIIIKDATRGIDFPENNIEKTMKDFTSKGGSIINSGEII